MLRGELTLTEYVQTVDDAYFSMLSTKLENPFLRNKGTYINLNGFMANFMGQTEMNERYKLKNGHLANINPAQITDEKLDTVFENITALYQAQAEQGKNFLFVLCPTQHYEQESLMPAGYDDIANQHIFYLLDKLDDAGIPYLDLREKLKEDGFSNTDAFFYTDHHWRPETAFWAYGTILETLADLGYIGPVDTFYTDKENFNFDVYENSFLGSSGKRTGIYFAGTDDFTVISPKFETEIHLQVPEAKADLTGRWEDIAYQGGDMSTRLQNPDYFNDNPYGRYGWSDRPISHWRNENAPEQAKFLLIGESYGNIPYSLMSMYISSCDEVDMRHFERDFTAHYQEYDPDTVILLVNVNSACTDNTLFPYFAD